MAFAIMVTVAMTSPVFVKASQCFGSGGYSAEADLIPSSIFDSASAYTENNNFGSSNVAVSLMAMDSAGVVFAMSGVDYSAHKAEESISGYGTATKYKSVHAIYDLGYNYIASMTIEKP